MSPNASALCTEQAQPRPRQQQQQEQQQQHDSETYRHDDEKFSPEIEYDCKFEKDLPGMDFGKG